MKINNEVSATTKIRRLEEAVIEAAILYVYGHESEPLENQDRIVGAVDGLLQTPPTWLAVHFPHLIPRPQNATIRAG
jgi:hypothetical protein